jgi:hypothetical protein
MYIGPNGWEPEIQQPFPIVPEDPLPESTLLWRLLAPNNPHRCVVAHSRMCAGRVVDIRPWRGRYRSLPKTPCDCSSFLLTNGKSGQMCEELQTALQNAVPDPAVDNNKGSAPKMSDLRVCRDLDRGGPQEPPLIKSCTLARVASADYRFVYS